MHSSIFGPGIKVISLDTSAVKRVSCLFIHTEPSHPSWPGLSSTETLGQGNPARSPEPPGRAESLWQQLLWL